MIKIVHKELSYKISDLLFEVHNNLSHRYQEKYYQRAFEVLLKRESISYRKELPFQLTFENNSIGKYYFDFLIEDKIIVEMKSKPFFCSDDYKQVVAYLKATGLELGILVNFRGYKLTYKRILNADAIRIYSG